MPNNKKKKGGRNRNNTERTAVLKLRAERNIPIESLPSFPTKNESMKEGIERMLGYKYISADDDTQHSQLISITRKEDGNKFNVQIFTNDMQPIRSKELGEYEFDFSLMPDYDRNEAMYPVAQGVMSEVKHKD